jgi:hypothetical protein
VRRPAGGVGFSERRVYCAPGAGWTGAESDTFAVVEVGLT